MPRFQSRLFNWIDQSLPAQIGRRVRRSLDQKFEQIAEALVGIKLQEVPQLLAYQVARAALYPVYILNKNVQKIFPILGDRPKDADAMEASASLELLTESKLSDIGAKPQYQKSLPSLEVKFLPESPEVNPQIDSDSLNPKTPWLLRPLLRFFDWIDRTKIKLDRNITAIIKPIDNSNNLDSFQTYIANRLSNRVSAKIWRRVIEEYENQNDAQDSLKESNALSENRALGRNRKIEYLRQLIEEAIAYFFGENASQDSELSMDALEADPNSHQMPQNLDGKAIEGDAKPRSRKFNLSSFNKIKQSDAIENSVNSSPLQELIAAAMDYFTSRRSLKQGKDKLEKLENTEEVLDPNSNSSGQIRLDDQIERLRKLIEAAVNYFFSKQRSLSELEATNSIETSQSASMESLFADDNGPWPLPLEYESVAFANSPDLTALNSSGELQIFETTTSQMSQERLEGGSFFIEETLIRIENERPLRAWIEAQATILGYVYSPVMTVVFWFDEMILKIENLIIRLWKKLLSLPKKLLGK
ncbi:MAG: hypothetical protein AUK48_15595 [Oscillatoriales cyanobacterium CG2_30_44_21]|nr:MAG: hypothetical protein AUK48_15595 [Oscillatoriales cyanobacterium CG2_30_44_21]